MSTDSTFLDAALSLAALGFRVLQLHGIVGGRCTCGAALCSSPGKHPLRDGGYKVATTNPDLIKQWWTDAPQANIGIATGDGLVVLDIDNRHGGDESLADLVREVGKPPDTVESQTGNGRHIYLHDPTGRIRTGIVDGRPGIDVKAEGGYVVAPPSRHWSGQHYQWEFSSHPDLVSVAHLPPAWLALLTRPKTHAGNGKNEEGIPQGERNQRICSIGGALRRQGVGERAVLDALLAINLRQCDPPLPEREVESIARSVARYPALIDSAELRTTSAAERKLTFSTAAEIAASTPETPDWLLHGYIAKGAITELDGKVKAAGKTTLIAAMVRCIVEGRPFAGRPTRRSPVVYLTEQSKTSFKEALRRADLLARIDVHILAWAKTRGMPWPEVVEGAFEKCKAEGAELVVVDTLPQFAGIRGEGENSSGAALEAVEPLQLMASGGVGSLISRHERKSGGEVGDSGRGSSAFAGAADIVLALTRAEGGNDRVRLLRSLSRYDETPAQWVIELDGEGHYISRGDESAYARTQARLALLEHLPLTEAAGITGAEWCSAARVARTTGQDALRELVSEGIAVKIGGGVKGDPFKYFRAEDAENLYAS